MDIFSGLTSVLSGGLTGIIGSVAQGVFEYKSKKLDVELQKEKYLNEIALKKADAEIMAQEWTARTKVSEIEADAKVETADSNAFAESFKLEPQKYSEGALTSKQNWLMVVLDFARGIIRPALTVYLCAVTTAIYFQCKMLMGTSLLPFQAYDLVDKIIQTILYLTTSCVLWWFGSRNKTKQK